MKDKLNEEDEQWMRQCCISMDTNAFEFIKVKKLQLSNPVLL